MIGILQKVAIVFKVNEIVNEFSHHELYYLDLNFSYMSSIYSST